MSQTVVRHRWQDIPAENVSPSVSRRYITADRVTVAQFHLKRGGVVPRHSHEQAQITCVMSGALEFVINGLQVVVSSGEVAQIPSWVEHEVRVLEDTVVIDVFSPVRQDWIDKTDDYFRR